MNLEQFKTDNKNKIEAGINAGLYVYAHNAGTYDERKHIANDVWILHMENRRNFTDFCKNAPSLGFCNVPNSKNWPDKQPSIIFQDKDNENKICLIYDPESKKAEKKKTDEIK